MGAVTLLCVMLSVIGLHGVYGFMVYTQISEECICLVGMSDVV